MKKEIKTRIPIFTGTRKYLSRNQDINLNCHKVILSVILFIGLMPFLQLKAQPVYPVTVNPQMITGGSVYIGDFANPMATANRLRYTLTLEDPVEQERTVYFRLTIVQNGTVIAANPIGFRGNTVTLQKNTPYLITGEDLALNLSINNLVGLSGPTAYGILDEGVTDFCLEVIDAFRGEPVSIPQCATGYLTRLQPPMLILPSDRQKIQIGRLNNLVFTWNMQDPLAHLPFSDISYRFELRKKIPSLNSQDRFESQPLIFSTTVDHFSLFYNETLSQLKPGNTYLWRVTAQFRNRAGIPQPNYFVHHGISRVGTFQVLPEIYSYEPKEIACDCGDEGCIPTVPQYSVSSKGLTLEDSVKYGAFYLHINSLTGNRGSGKGSIYIPFLNTSVAIEFSNININALSQAISGQVFVSVSDLVKKIQIDKDRLPDLSMVPVNAEWLQDMNQYVTDSSRDISLPISLGNKLAVHGFNMPYEVFITDLQFNYNKPATATLVLSILNSSGQVYNFGASGVSIGRYGFDLDGLKLYLLNDTIKLSGIGAEPIVVKRAVNDNPAQGSFVSFSCEGLENFNLQAEYVFPLNQLQGVEHPEQQVVAQLTLRGSTWEKLNGYGHIPQFTIKDAPGWEFAADKVVVDLSALSNPSEIVFPDGYDISGNEWKGFYLQNVKIKLPKKIKVGSDSSISYTTPRVLLDANGVTCNAMGTDILDFSKGKVGDWAFSIDTINLDIFHNKYIDTHVFGNCGIGIKDAVLSYDGLITRNIDDEYKFDLSPTGTFAIPFLKLNAQVKEGSLFIVENDKATDTYKPYADLNLQVDLQITENEFRNAGLGKQVDEIKKTLNISKFDYSVTGLILNHFKINSPDLPQGVSYGLGSAMGGVAQISGMPPLTIGEVSLLSRKNTFDGSKQPGLGLIIHTNMGLSSIVVGTWAKKFNNKGHPDYTFGKYELHAPEFTGMAFIFSCKDGDTGENNQGSEYCNPPDISGGTPTTVHAGNQVMVGHFKMNINDIDASGNGTGDVEVSFLNLSVRVNFKDLSFKKMSDGIIRLVEGSVVSVADPLLGDINLDFSGTEGPLNLAGISVTQDFINQVENLSSRSTGDYAMPFSLRNKLELITGIALPTGTNLILMGINFNPDAAHLNALMTVKMSTGGYLIFGLSEIELRPDGFDMDKIKFYLVKEL